MNRLSPLKIRNHQLSNRLVVPPMASQTSTLNGVVTSEGVSHYQRLASSGAGLVFAEYTYVSQQGKSEPNQLGADSDDKIEGLQKIASVIKESGATAILQLTHGGSKSSSQLTGEPLVAPSAIAVPMRQGQGEVPEAATLEQIAQIKSDFAAAARRAVKAGFDGVELHSAHGYGLNQWLSPLTNQRSDLYGGSLDGRTRLLLEIVSKIRHSWPDLLLSVRIPGQDHLPGGLHRHEMQEVSRRLQQAGVDILNVSSGLGGWRRPPDRRGQGYLVEEAQAMQSVVQMPVIGVGGIVDGDYIDRELANQSFQLAAVGRAILSDPVGWRQKHLAEASKAS